MDDEAEREEQIRAGLRRMKETRPPLTPWVRRAATVIQGARGLVLGAFQDLGPEAAAAMWEEEEIQAAAIDAAREFLERIKSNHQEVAKEDR